MGPDATINIIGRVRAQVLNPLTSIDRFKFKYLSNNRIGQFILKYFPAHYTVLSDTGFERNLVTNAGKAGIAGLVGNTGSVPAAIYLALGTSAVAATVLDTILGAEIVDSGLSRTTATISRVTTSVTNDTLQLVNTFTASGSKVVAEVGVFNASSSGTLFAHKIFSSTTSLVSGNVFTVTYQIQFT